MMSGPKGRFCGTIRRALVNLNFNNFNLLLLLKPNFTENRSEVSKLQPEREPSKRQEPEKDNSIEIVLTMVVFLLIV